MKHALGRPEIHKKILIGKPEPKQLERSRDRWENNSKKGLEEIRCDCVD
jgi:hypothetical protein